MLNQFDSPAVIFELCWYNASVRHRNRGALLLEVLLGIGIFATALLFSFGVFPNSAKASAQSRNYTIARAIARDYLDREMVRNFDDVGPPAPQPAPPWPAVVSFEPREVVTDGVRVQNNFQVSVEVDVLDDRDAGDPIDRKHIKVTVAWNLGSDSQREVFLESWVTQ